MGEAFVAVADDGNAIYWNPAGLAQMERIQASFAYADLFGLGINSFYASFLSRVYFIPPLTDYLAFGADWFRIHTRDADPYTGKDELEFAQDQINFSLAFRPPKSVPWLRNLSLGANLKYLKIRGSLDGASEGNLDGWGWDGGLLYDFGALPRVPNGLQFGLMVHNGGDGLWAKNTATENSSKILHENLRWGLSYRPFREWPGGKVPISDPVLALDFDDRVHLGLEFWLARTLALRAGWQKDWRTNESSTFAFGLGLKKVLKDLPEVNVDYALTDSPVLPNTNKQFGGSLIVKNDPRLIRIEEAYINDVFASLYQHYGGPVGDLGRAKIRNIHGDTLIAEVTFVAPPYTPRNPAPQNVKLPPGQLIEVPLRAVFDRGILESGVRERLNGRIEIGYFLSTSWHFRTARNVDYVLHGAGTLTWDDPGKAAAFVTIGEKCVREFAQRIVPQDSLRAAPPSFFTDNMISALRLHEALRALGFSYAPDRTTPFAAVAGKELAVDQIQYPAKFLATKNKSGDCDDLAVLYSTLLESIGIETALLSTPTHLFMMFNTGLPARRQNSLPVDTTLFVNYRGMLWMPIEATAVQSSFLYAWVKGSKKYRDALAENSVAIVEIAENQRRDRYPPAEISAADSVDLPVPPLASRVAANFATLATITESYVQKFEDGLHADPENVKWRNQYAVILGQNGEREKARAHLSFILKKNPRHAEAINNLANIEFIEGNFLRAESLYVLANRYNTLNKAGTYLNLSLLYEMMVDTTDAASRSAYKEKSIAALTEAGRWLHNDSDFALYLLGLPSPAIKGKGEPDEKGKAAAAPDDTSKIKPKLPRPPQPAESWLSKKARIVTAHIKHAMRTLLEGKPLRHTVFDQAGSKGEGAVDEDRPWLLWWST
jgi:tetratricopeptide (TPR) repeat protein